MWLFHVEHIHLKVTWIIFCATLTIMHPIPSTQTLTAAGLCFDSDTPLVKIYCTYYGVMVPKSGLHAEHGSYVLLLSLKGLAKDEVLSYIVPGMQVETD